MSDREVHLPPEADGSFDVVPVADIDAWREKLSERFGIGKGDFKSLDDVADAAAGNKGMTVLWNIVRTVCILVPVAALLGIMPAVERYGAMNVFATIMLVAFGSLVGFYALFCVVYALRDIFSEIWRR